ncbi:MAG: hypothetical protein Q9188_002124 [Gyalolechia gomerana]
MIKQVNFLTPIYLDLSYISVKGSPERLGDTKLGELVGALEEEAEEPPLKVSVDRTRVSAALTRPSSIEVSQKRATRVVERRQRRLVMTKGMEDIDLGIFIWQGQAILDQTFDTLGMRQGRSIDALK